MKPFKLQTLLDYRKRVSDKAHEALMAAMEERDVLAASRETEENEVNRLCRELEAEKSRDISVPEMMLYEQCISAKKRHVRDLDQQLTRAEAKIREKRQELVKARQKKRVLEILKEKRETAERSKREHQEKMLIDEVAVLGFGGGK